MKFSTHPATIFVIAVCVAAIASALAAQYGFGLKPCELCLAQRIPFLVGGLLGAASAYPGLATGLRNGLIALAGVLLLGNSGLAFYHVGVEHHWWASSCSSANSPPVDVSGADFLASLNRPATVSCDQPSWEWHGITMAAMNIVYSFGAGVVTLGLLIKGKRYGW